MDGSNEDQYTFLASTFGLFVMVYLLFTMSYDLVYVVGISALFSIWIPSMTKTIVHNYEAAKRQYE